MDLYEKLCVITAQKKWNDFVDTISPKYFQPHNKKTLKDKRILAKLAETLTSPGLDVPPNIQIIILKCLANSCVDGFKQADYLNSVNDDETLETSVEKMYKSVSERAIDTDENVQYFPYKGVLQWCINYVTDCTKSEEEHSEETNKVLQFCIQFIVNLEALACDTDGLDICLKTVDFKTALKSCLEHHYVPVVKAVCLYIHNKLTRIESSDHDVRHFWLDRELYILGQPLIKAHEQGIDTAGDILILLLKRPDWLKNTYEDLSIECKLYLLEMIHQDVCRTVYADTKSETRTEFPLEVMKFASERFKKRSDLILKTVDSYLIDMEPMEVTLLLDIIGVVSSENSIESQLLQSDKSLIINCIFLLKSLHMTGKTSENHFTPLQKLSDLSLAQATDNSESENDVQKHPAFGFKAGLIRAIGNLAHRHKDNQKLLRETDAIPLLLDCCNIDARNPLIMQWTILALRNACDNSPENQEIIRNCNKIGVVDNEVLRSAGLTLHEEGEGKAIGIIPLPKKE